MVQVSGRIVGVHSLSERLPIKQGGFEVEQMSFRNKQKYTEWVFTRPPGLLAQSDSKVALPRQEPPKSAGKP